MSKITFKQAAKKRGIDPKLAAAVLRQLGTTAKEVEKGESSLEDIARHGIDGGYRGFTYYSDTVKFYEANKAAILDMAANMAEQFDQTTAEMMAGFGCLKGTSAREIEATLIRGKKSDDYTRIANALAWFAGEEVARAWADRNEY